MKVTVKFYSLLKAKAGVGHVDLDVKAGATIEDLIPILMERFENLPLNHEHVHFLHNDKNAPRDKVLSEGDSVTILTLFAGG